MTKKWLHERLRKLRLNSCTTNSHHLLAAPMRIMNLYELMSHSYLGSPLLTGGGRSRGHPTGEPLGWRGGFRSGLDRRWLAGRGGVCVGSQGDGHLWIGWDPRWPCLVVKLWWLWTDYIVTVCYCMLLYVAVRILYELLKMIPAWGVQSTLTCEKQGHGSLLQWDCRHGRLGMMFSIC